MQYIIPDYYKEFSCTADKCEDTCCAGWQIAVDRKSLIKYGKVKGPFRRRLNKSVNWTAGTFRQKEEKRCAFLEENNLCGMYQALGEKSLCRTCRLYPRHMEEFEGVREITLSVSCPEVARILLAKKEPVHFLTSEKEGEEEYEDFDLFLYSKLVDAREAVFSILQNRDLEMEVRASLVLGLAHDVQRRVDKGEIFSCEEVFERYQTESARQFVQSKICEWRKKGKEQFLFSRERFMGMYELERLREEWEHQLGEAAYELYGKGAVHYVQLHSEFDSWLREQMPHWSIQSEQLLVYFISTYFCGAVYDGRVFAKVQMAVVSVFLIYELMAACWRKNGKQLNTEEVTAIVYRYSRELEHSDTNLELMEKMMKEWRIRV